MEWRTDRPTNEGTYLVTLAIPNGDWDEEIGRYRNIKGYSLEVSTRYFGRDCIAWRMVDEPQSENELAWTEESGSSAGEKVAAWSEMPEAYKPNNVTWSEPEAEVTLLDKIKGLRRGNSYLEYDEAIDDVIKILGDEA